MFKKYLTSFIVSLFFVSVSLGQNVGSPAPDFTLNSLEHGQISLSQNKGKVVFLFFFGYN
jgi:peroxiredoxin